MMRNRMLSLILAVMLCVFPVFGVLAAEYTTDEEEVELSDMTSEEEVESSETVSEEEAESSESTSEESDEADAEIGTVESEKVGSHDEGEEAIVDELAEIESEQVDSIESEDSSESGFDEIGDEQEEDTAILYNVFCVNTVDDAVAEVQEDEEIVMDEEMEVDDFVSVLAGDEEYQLHSVGVFYHMDGEDFANNLVPEFYMDTDDFWEFDEEEGSFLFTNVPPEDVSIVFYMMYGSSLTMAMDVNAELVDAVPVQTQAQLLRPVATGVVTDTIPFLVIGGFGMAGLAGRMMARRKESL